MAGFRAGQIHNQFWGQGFASEAARLALKLGFGPVKLNRVEASCEPNHKASRRVAEKARLRYEGIRRKFFIKGAWVDIAVYGMNAVDYKRRAN